MTSLRIVIVLHALAILTQAVFAGQFLSGVDAQVLLHERTAWVALALCLIQIALAAILFRSGAVSLWLLIGSVFIFLAEGLQVGTGFGRLLIVHIPLGVVVFGALCWQCLSVFRKDSRP